MSDAARTVGVGRSDQEAIRRALTELAKPVRQRLPSASIGAKGTGARLALP